MGYPISDISNIDKFIRSQQVQPNFYAIVLYKEKHHRFKRFFRHEFKDFYNTSDEKIHFFIFDTYDFYGNRFNYRIHEKAIDILCERYDIADHRLPAIILFNEWNASDFTLISLKKIHHDKESCKKFFEFLFDPIPVTPKDVGFENSLKTSYIRRKFGEDFIVKHQISLNSYEYDIYRDQVEEHTIFEVIQNILSELNNIKQLRHYVESLIEPERNKLKAIKKQNRIENQGKHYELDLDFGYSKVVDSMIEIADSMVENLNKLSFATVSNKDPKYENFTIKLDLFEKESINMIKTSLDLAKYLPTFEHHTLDYSPFVAGYWKALENELAIITRDLLLCHKSYIENIPYNNQTSLKTNKPYSLTWNKSGAGTSKQIDIKLIEESNRNLKVSNVMLGQSKLIIEDYTNNDYSPIMAYYLENIKEFNYELFKRNIADMVRYRNNFSHRKSMPLPVFEAIENIIFEDKLFDQIAQLKKHSIDWILKLNSHG